MEFTKSGITVHVVYIVCSSRPTFKVVFIVVHTAPYIVSTERGGKDSKRRRGRKLRSKFARLSGVQDLLYIHVARSLRMSLCKPMTESDVTILAKVPPLQKHRREILRAYILKQKKQQTLDGKKARKCTCTLYIQYMSIR